MNKSDNAVVALLDHRHKLCAALIGEDATKAVSFDMFDTLTVRNVFDPKDLFDRIAHDPAFPADAAGSDFPNLRIRAESQVRARFKRQGRNIDPTLDDIYRELRDAAGIEDHAAETLKRLECAAEIAAAQPRPALKLLYDYAVDLGKHVIICTDMYLPKTVIDEILRKCGYARAHTVFLSSESGHTKKHGEIFHHIARKFELDAHQCLHFGDNAHSDIKMAKQAGWRAMKTPAVRDFFLKDAGALHGLVPPFASSKQMPGEASKATYALLSNRVFGGALTPPSADAITTRDFGYVALGPFLLSLALWMLRLARQKHIDHIAFLARDGHLPIQAARLAAQATGEATRMSYLPISRRVLFPYFLQQPGGIEKILSIRYDPRQTIEKYLSERFGETALELFSKAAQSRTGLSPAGFMKDHHDFVCDILRDNLDVLQAETADKNRNLVAYYREKLPQAENAALFDVGRKGTFQAALSQIAGGPLHGFYVVTNYEILKNAPGRAFDSFLGMMDSRMREKNPDTILYETMLSEKAGSFAGFDANGAPQRLPNRTSAEELSFFNELHAGALDFVKDAIEAHGERVSDLEQEGFYAAYALENWPQNDSAVALLSAVRHEDAISTPEAKSLKDYFLNPQANQPHTLFPPKGAHKRIMIYCPAMTRIRGGAERITARLANHLCKEGYEVLVFTSGERGNDNTPVYPLEPGVLVRNVNVRDVDEMAQLVKAYAPDCGLALASGPPVIRISLAFLMNRIPYMLSERASPEHSRKTYWKDADPSEYAAAYEAAAVTAVQFESFREAFPENMRARIVVLPNPIERPALKTRAREKVILCAARIWFDQKRQDLLLRAFAGIAAKHPDWRLVFYGDTYGQDGQALAALARKLKISDRVIIRPPIANISEEYEKASIFALPSRFEGFPNALAEALSTGTPAIGFASCPGVNELIIDGENGLLVDDRDIEALSAQDAAQADPASTPEEDIKFRKKLAVAEESDADAFLPDQLAARLGRALSRMIEDKSWRISASKAAHASMARYDEASMNARWSEAVRALCEMDGGLYATQRRTALEAQLVKRDGEVSFGGGRAAASGALAGALNGAHSRDYATAIKFLTTAPVSLTARAKLFIKKKLRANGSAADTLLFDTLLAPHGNVILPIPADFDEAAYLKNNPDIAAAVAAGAVQSGYVHYIRHGFAEGRRRPNLASSQAGVLS